MQLLLYFLVFMIGLFAGFVITCIIQVNNFDKQTKLKEEFEEIQTEKELFKYNCLEEKEGE